MTKTIKTILISPQFKKLSLMVFVVSLLFFGSTFAQEATTENTKVVDSINSIIDMIIGLCSRMWILLASLAGKLMTNDMVYGSWLHMDVYLWKMRNICKNFANFGLLGILLREIIQQISSKGESIQKIISKTLIAGILIQASWFLFAAVIDISTIATAAVASFPNQFLEGQAFTAESISKNIQKTTARTTKVGENGSVTTTENNTLIQGDELKKAIEKIMPKSDSVAGPLVYLGASTLNIQSMLTTDNKAKGDAKSTATTGLLQFLIIIIFTLSMGLLVIVNFIRIGLLWIIIPFSPILVLMMIMGKDLGKDGIMKNFNISVILHAIFKPVLFAAVLSLILIFISTMQTVMNTEQNKVIQIQDNTITTTDDGKATIDMGGIATTTINEAIFTNKNIGGTVKGIFSNIIVYFTTIFLLRYLIKIAAKAGGGTIGETMDSVTKTIEDTSKLMPVVPIGGGMSRNQMQYMNNNTKDDLFQQNLGMSSSGMRKNDKEEAFIGDIMRDLDLLQGLQDYDYRNLERSKNFVNDTTKIIETNGLDIADKKRQGIFENWLKKNPTTGENGLGDWKDDDTLEKFLNKKGTENKYIRQDLYKKREKYNTTKTVPTRYEDFMNLSFKSKNSKK